ncbi:MAG: hypothetical protein U0163_03875 [Gemmatimonadaceae bacterium]
MAIAGAPGADIIRDRFIVFPSLQPFARAGLASSMGVAANDTLYRTPNEYLYYSTRNRSTGCAPPTRPMATPATARSRWRPSRSGRVRARDHGWARATRDVDYTSIDYDLGRVTLLRADAFGATPRRVVVRYEENPLFASIPTSIIGLASEVAFSSGTVGVTALSQSQRTNLTRPTLGPEPQASLVAGVNADFVVVAGLRAVAAAGAAGRFVADAATERARRACGEPAAATRVAVRRTWRVSRVMAGWPCRSLTSNGSIPRSQRGGVRSAACWRRR